MQGISERGYAEHAGLSRGAVQKAKAAGRLVHLPDGSIDDTASDARRVGTTDPAKQRRAPRMKPVPAAAVAGMGATLREQGLKPLAAAGGTIFLRARTANEVLKAQKRRLESILR